MWNACAACKSRRGHFLVKGFSHHCKSLKCENIQSITSEHCNCNLHFDNV